MRIPKFVERRSSDGGRAYNVERAEAIIKRVNMFEEVTDVRAFVRTLLAG